MPYSLQRKSLQRNFKPIIIKSLFIIPKKQFIFWKDKVIIIKKIEIIPHGWLIVRYMYPYLTLLIIPVIKGIFIKNSVSQFLIFEAVAVIVSFLVSVIKRIKFKCVLSESGIFIKKGLFIKKEFFVPITKAMVISVERNILLKIFKTANLKIYGSFGKKKEKFLDIPVSLNYAKKIEDLYSIKPYNEIFELGIFKTLLTSATDTPITVGLFIFITVINQIRKILGKSVKDIVFYDILNPEYSLILLMEKSVKIIVIFLILVYIITFLNAFLKNVGFKVFEHNNIIKIKAGIIPQRSISFNSNDVLAALVHKNFIFRLFGICSVRISVCGYGTETGENCLILPLIKEKTAKLFFSIYFPNIVLNKAEIKPPKRTKVRYLRLPFIIFSVTIVLNGVIFFLFNFFNEITGLILIVSFVFCFILFCSRYFFYKNGGLFINKQNISVLSYALFSQTELHFKTENTEMIRFFVNPFDKRKKLVKVKFYVLGKNRNKIKVKNISVNNKNKILNNVLI